MRDIGKNIRTERMRKNLTQDELAERLHTTRQTVSNYETGRSRPDVDMLMQIADSLGVEVTTLLYGAEVLPERKKELKKFWITAGVFVTLVLMCSLALPMIRQEVQRTFRGHDWLFIISWLMHPLMFGLGWSAMQGAGVFLGAKPLKAEWKRWARIGIIIAAVLFLLPMTLTILQFVMVQLGFEGWNGFSEWPRWARKWLLLGYTFVSAEFRWIMFALGAAFWMTKKR